MTHEDIEHCRKCRFHGYVYGGAYTCCLYLADTGEVRGCPGGVECTRFQEGKPGRRADMHTKATEAELKDREDRVAVTDYLEFARKRMRLGGRK